MILRGWTTRPVPKRLSAEQDLDTFPTAFLIAGLAILLVAAALSVFVIRPLFFSDSTTSFNPRDTGPVFAAEPGLLAVSQLLENGRLLAAIHDAHLNDNILELEVMTRRVSAAAEILAANRSLANVDRNAYDALGQLLQIYRQTDAGGTLHTDSYRIDQRLMSEALTSLTQRLQDRRQGQAVAVSEQGALQQRLAWSLCFVLAAATLPVIFSLRLLRRARELGAALHYQQQNSDEMLRQVPGAMVIADSHGNIQQVSDALCTLLGYSRAQLTGQPADILVPGRLRQQYAVMVRNAFAGNTTGQGREILVSNKAGEEFAAELHMSAGDFGGRKGLMVCVRDMREERELYERYRESQRRFDMAALAARDGLWEWSLTDDRIYLSHNWRQMMDWQAVIPGEEPTRFWQSIPEADRAPYRSALLRFFRSGGYLFSHEHRVVRSDGKVLDILCRASAQRDSKGRVIRLVGLDSDITAFKEREREVRRLNRILEDRVRLSSAQLEEALENADSANQAISAFLAVMGHEIRTPMNGVVGMTELLAKTELDREQKMLLQTLTRSSESLLATLDNILDYASLEAGTLTLAPQPVQLQEFLEGVADAVAQKVARNRQRFYLNIDPSLPAEISFDPIRLRQVLTALLDNAVKFSAYAQPVGEIEFQVRLEAKADELALAFRVLDNGIGISSDIRGRLFRPFVQQDISRTRRFSGAGLGLAIARNLALLMGGDIVLEDSADWKACFTFLLPLPADTVRRDPVTAGCKHQVVAMIGDARLARSLQLAAASHGIAVELAASAEALDQRLAADTANMLGCDCGDNKRCRVLISDQSSHWLPEKAEKAGYRYLPLLPRPVSEREVGDAIVYTNPLLPSALYLNLERHRQDPS